MADDSLFAVREITKQYQRTEDVDIDLSIVAPQAMLRDLHRPVKSFMVSIMDFGRYEFVLDGGRGAVAEAKVPVRTSYRVPITELLPTHAMAKAAWAELRATLKQPWGEIPRFHTEYAPSWKQVRTWG